VLGLEAWQPSTLDSGKLKNVWSSTEQSSTHCCGRHMHMLALDVSYPNSRAEPRFFFVYIEMLCSTSPLAWDWSGSKPIQLVDCFFIPRQRFAQHDREGMKSELF
jgi:hypothetical protein